MLTVLITGTNRGLGLEMVRQYAGQGWTVLACCRHPKAADELQKLAAYHPDQIEVHALDVADFDQIDALAQTLEGRPIDLLINNAGIFGPKYTVGNDMRQQFGHMDYDIWVEVLRVNTFAPMKMVERFIRNIEAGRLKKIAVISSVIGSSTDAEGQFYAYGSSKAAVSKVFANLAVDLAPKGIAVGIFCPGWVPTEMGGPGAHVPIEDSIAGLRARIDELTLENAGQFRRYNNDALHF